MVEAVATTQETSQLGFTTPDPTNAHRTFNMTYPYGRYRNRLRNTRTYLRMIGPSDPALGSEKKVIDQMATPEESVKRIE